MWKEWVKSGNQRESYMVKWEEWGGYEDREGDGCKRWKRIWGWESTIADAWQEDVSALEEVDI